MMRRVKPSLAYCVPEQPAFEDFNINARIPFGVSVGHLFQAMMDFTDFLRTVDTELARKKMSRLEDMLMPANFSSMVGEFITSNLPKHCPTIAKNASITVIRICFRQGSILGTQHNTLGLTGLR